MVAEIIQVRQECSFLKCLVRKAMALIARDMSGAVRRTSSMGSKPEILTASQMLSALPLIVLQNSLLRCESATIASV